MKTQWLGNLRNEARAQREKEVLAAKNVLDILYEIVYNMYKEEVNVKSTDYDSPSWSHLQAHKNGRREMARQLLEIVKIDGPLEPNV